MRAPSTTRMRGWARTRSASCAPRGRQWPRLRRGRPAAASARLRGRAVVELDPEVDEVADPRRRLLGEHETALGRESPRPVRSVSSAWRAGVSPSPTAAAMPPCASELVEESSGPLERTSDVALGGAHSAPNRPATPPPTTRRSTSSCRPLSVGVFSVLSLMVVFSPQSR